jgi:transposase
MVYAGSQGRNRESNYPPWQSVYYYFRKWQKTGLWEQILDAFVVKEGKAGKVPRHTILKHSQVQPAARRLLSGFDQFAVAHQDLAYLVGVLFGAPA